MDPFVDLIRLLRPEATLWGAIRGAGIWAVSFRARGDLLFFRIDRGTCLLLRPHEETRELSPRDLILIRTTAPFTLASDPAADAVDSENLVAATRSTEMHVGEGQGELCGCSRSAFNQRFTDIVGVAPIRYLQQWRIAVAKRELRLRRHSVAEIALLVGFQSGGAFSTAFTRAVGCSPSTFAEKGAAR